MQFKTKQLARIAGFLVWSLGLVYFHSEAAEAVELRNPAVGYPTHQDLSPALRDITPVPPPLTLEWATLEIPRPPIPRPVGPKVPLRDPVLQALPVAPAMPSPIQNFAGVGNVNGVLPPDTNGDVGPNHYVQMVNLSFAIWNKSGTLLYGPANNNTLWSGFGGPCQTYNNGDPIVLYDHQADRWLMSQFALPSYPSGPFYQCIAISQTGDPTGAWYRYAFLVHNTKMNDYPKFGVWPDGYYMSVNQFTSTGAWAGAGVFVFDRTQMLAGSLATFQYFDLAAVSLNWGSLLPSDWDGPTAPPSGAPNNFISVDDDAWGYSPDALHLWEFHVDWVTPANSTFTGPVERTTAAFDSNMCGYSRDCIPQPGVASTAYLDALSDRLMYRLQYRNFGSYEAMVTNHTVDVDGTNHAGIRWYELRKGISGWTINQQGTYAPDSDHRWMGSIAMDSTGNMALGYSVASSSLYPSIRYTGRLVGDTLGTLPQGETTLIAGGGSQTHTASRWGDYSMMAVDPSDNCTFWYTTEYYAATSSAGWLTRIGSFKFPSCGSGGGFTISGTVTTAGGGGGGAGGGGGGTPLSGVTMSLTGTATATTTTDASGNYSFGALANGGYTVTPTRTGYAFTPVNRAVTVSGANVTGQNFTATPNNPPNTPSSPSPANAATGVSLTPTLSWTGGDPDVGNTVTYDIYFGTSASPPLVVSNNATTSYAPGTLLASTLYYWRIVARDNLGATTSGPTWSFTTGSGGGFTISGTVTTAGGGGGGVGTGGGGGGTPLSGVTMSLTGTATASTTTDGSGNYSFGALANGGYTVTPTRTGYAFTPVNRAVTVSGADVTGQNFTATPNNPPNVPGSPSPANGATGVSTTPTLSWTGGDPDVGQTVTYDIYFGTSASPPLVVSNNATTSYAPGTLLASTLYYWRIVARDNLGATTSGPTWSFTTGSGGGFTISGTVTTAGGGGGGVGTGGGGGGTPLSGVTMSLTGTATASTTTDGSGNYSFGALANGGYTVTPTRTGYAFTPVNRAVTVSGANVTGQNFTGTSP